MKLSPIDAIPHNPKAFISILNLSFSVKLTPQVCVPSVNEKSDEKSPGGAIDQIRHLILNLIHDFAEAPECANIFRQNGISWIGFGG